MQEAIPRRCLNARERTERAYRAHAGLLTAAEILRERAIKRLDAFDLTLSEYRMMEEIYRRGPQYRREVARRIRCSHKNIDWMTEKLKELGWVRCVATRWVAREAAGEGLQSRARRNGNAGAAERRGRAVSRIYLTADGRERIEAVIWRYAKFVEAEMRALEGREQETLSRMCGKLRAWNSGSEK